MDIESAPRVPKRDLPQLTFAIWVSLAFVAVLWFVKFVEIASLSSFHWLGVRPGEWYGLLGVLTSPLVHGSFEHLIMNSVPILVMLALALFNYPKGTVRALPLIWILSGIGIWLIGRPSWHFGASGIAHGLMFYLFFLGLLRQDRNAIVVAMVTFFLYGGMVVTVLPREPNVSWEAHLSGAVAGALAALLWRKLDPPAPEPKPSWELEEEAEAAERERERSELELPRPGHVPVLWQRGIDENEPRGRVIFFPVRPRPGQDEPPTTLH